MNRSYIIRLAMVGLMALALTCSSNPTDDVDDDNPDDVTPPATVTDLHTIAVTTSTVTLGWTAPGDDGMTGYAMEYDLRGSLDSITEATFDSATQVTELPPPAPAGALQTHQIDELPAGQTYYFALKTRDDAGNYSALSNCCHADCPAEVVVVFPDTVLERIVREHINKPSGDILSSDVDTVTEINAEDQKVSDLTGVEHFTNLVFLHLIDNDVMDISPLAGLDKLWSLNLGGNQISDISPLGNLINLSQLSLAQNPVTDLTPLTNLTNLTGLSLDNIPATDFSPLEGMAKLETLRLSYDSLSDISFLSAQHQSLRTLFLTNNNISDLAPLATFTALEELQLQVNRTLSDLTPLQGLVNLKYAILGICNISDIQPLIDNTGLGAGDLVDLTGNPLPNGSANAQLQQLRDKGVDVRF